jgi:hypothetical protein
MVAVSRAYEATDLESTIGAWNFVQTSNKWLGKSLKACFVRNAKYAVTQLVKAPKI